jgi:hypothetical protein
MAITVPIVSEWNPKGLDRAVADINKADGGLGKFTSGIKAMGPAATVAFGALAAGGMLAIGAAEEAATANAALSNVLDSMGYGDATARVMEYADALSKQIGVDDESIKRTQTKLATFSELAKSSDQLGGMFDRATQAAYDMAAAGFGTAETNATQLGKALENPAKGMTALSRSGVSFTDAEKKKIKALQESGNMLAAQEIIMKAVEKQTGGTAAASANGSDKMKTAFGEVAEAIGAGLLPMFDRMVPHVEKLAGFLQDNATVIVAVGGAFAAAAGGIMVMAGALKALEVIKGVIALVKALNLAVLANPWVLAAAAIIALVVVVVKNWDTIKRVIGVAWDWIKAKTDAVWGAIKSALTAVWNAIKTAIKTYVTAWKTIITTVWNAIKTVVTTAVNAVRTTIARVFSAIKSVVTTYVNGWKAVISGAMTAIKTAVRVGTAAVKALFSGDFGKLKGIVSGAVGDVVGVVKTIPGKITGALGNLGSLLYGKGRDLVQGLINGIRDMIGGLKGVVGNLLDLLPGRSMGLPTGVAPRLARGGLLGEALAPLSSPSWGLTVNPIAPLAPIDVHIHLDDERLRGLVRVEIADHNATTTRRILAGARR